MEDYTELFARAAARAASFRRTVSGRPVGVPADIDELRRALGGPLNAEPRPALDVVEELATGAESGIVATAGPRYFGFVTGGSVPAAAAADILATGWDQNGFNVVYSPAAAVAEQVAGGWLKQLLGIPASASVGFATGSQEANTIGLAAGRHAVLDAVGWDVGKRGLAGAPAIRVVAGEERHATIDRSLRLLGLGNDSVDPVRTDHNGRIDRADLQRVIASDPDRPLIVTVQSGNVNTGACDDLRAAADLTHAAGGWLHVDGAFGLWAAVVPRLEYLVDGIELADSWGCDGHKWLNVPYDSAFAFCAHPDVAAAAVSYTASYLVDSPGSVPVPSDFVLGSSRRARGFAVWAALRELGRAGLRDLVDRNCALARRFADRLAHRGLDIVNDVMLNQVLVGFGDDSRTDEIVGAIQRDGTCWMGATTWRGRRLMRIAVSNWSTTEADVDVSADAVLRIAAEFGALP